MACLSKLHACLWAVNTLREFLRKFVTFCAFALEHRWGFCHNLACFRVNHECSFFNNFFSLELTSFRFFSGGRISHWPLVRRKFSILLHWLYFYLNLRFRSNFNHRRRLGRRRLSRFFVGLNAWSTSWRNRKGRFRFFTRLCSSLHLLSDLLHLLSWNFNNCMIFKRSSTLARAFERI